MKDLLILGTGPHAREMLTIAERLNRATATWNVVGVVSSDPHLIGSDVGGFTAMTMSDAKSAHPSALMVPEFEWPNKSDLPRNQLATLIDPDAFVAATATIGLGCVIYPHTFIGSYARIGDFLFCLAGTVINHNDVIEDRVTLTSGVLLAGDVTVEADCYLGQGCNVRELLTVGRGSLIGMGAVVLHNVAPNSVMIGNPARRSRSRVIRNPLLRFARRVRRKLKKEVAALIARARSAYVAGTHTAERSAT